MNERYIAILTALIGVVATILGTFIGYWLSRRRELEEEKRELVLDFDRLNVSIEESDRGLIQNLQFKFDIRMFIENGSSLTKSIYALEIVFRNREQEKGFKLLMDNNKPVDIEYIPAKSPRVLHCKWNARVKGKIEEYEGAETVIKYRISGRAITRKINLNIEIKNGEIF